MRRRWAIVAALLLVVLFVGATQAIVSVTLLDLEIQISRDRLFNYELSSRVLKENFRRIVEQREDFSSELQKNLLESAVMNEATPEDLSMSLPERIGLGLVNGVRFASFKSARNLGQDQRLLVEVKLAFLFERNRRYGRAVEMYSELAPRLEAAGAPDLHGFTLLHHGYCLAVQGEREGAIQKLEETRGTYPGSHYAETAALLIELLRENQERADRIEESELTPLEKAREYFSARLYDNAQESYKDLRPLAPMDQYRYFRSLEETGRVEVATEGYKRIVRENRDATAVREANRRLMLIGSFYGGDRQTKTFAEQKARELGDTEALEEVQQAASRQREAVVVEEIYAQAEEFEELAALRDEVEQEIFLEEAAEQSGVVLRPSVPELSAQTGFDAPSAVASPPAQPSAQSLALQRPARPDLLDLRSMTVRLRDGREFRAQSLDLSSTGDARIEGNFPVRVPGSVLAEVEAQGGPNAARLRVRLRDGSSFAAQRLRFPSTTEMPETAEDGSEAPTARVVAAGVAGDPGETQPGGETTANVREFLLEQLERVEVFAP